jgi:hypothetical protein
MCDYSGPHFGATYPDAVCIDGYLWDAYSGFAVEDGWCYAVGGDDPCPQCNTLAALERVKESVESGYTPGGTPNPDIWRGAVEHCRRLNPDATDAALKSIGPVRALDPTAEDEDRVTVLNEA